MPTLAVSTDHPDQVRADVLVLAVAAPAAPGGEPELLGDVPVSVRAQEEHGTRGNKLAVMRGPLPVYIKDPAAPLRFVRKAMDGLKES